jgi:hypothetical protein
MEGFLEDFMRLRDYILGAVISAGIMGCGKEYEGRITNESFVARDSFWNSSSDIYSFTISGTDAMFSIYGDHSARKADLFLDEGDRIKFTTSNRGDMNLRSILEINGKEVNL